MPTPPTVAMRAPAVDLTGWETRLTQLAAGLNLDHPADRGYFAARLTGAADTDTLAALAHWLGPAPRTRDRDRLARHIADAWPAEMRKRAAAARTAAAGKAFARIPAPPSDEPW